MQRATIKSKAHSSVMISYASQAAWEEGKNEVSCLESRRLSTRSHAARKGSPSDERAPRRLATGLMEKWIHGLS
jgi:hypothetical protein